MTRSQSRASEPTKHLLQIHEIVSRRLYEIKDLTDAANFYSTSVSEEHFRLLCHHRCLRLGEAEKSP